jgi:hypothetical protein
VTTPAGSKPSPPEPSSWLSIAVPAAAWGAQGLLGWYVAAHACAEAGPRTLGLTAGGARGLIGALTILAVAASAISLVSAIRRRGGRILEDVHDNDRDVYLAKAGVFVAASLTVGLVFAGLSSVFLVFCGVTR